MKRTFFYFAFLISFLPLGVFAETQFVASRYCPDQTKIFKGSIYHTDDGKPWIEVKVDPEDMGLLIGRAGSTAKAVRTLARIIGMRNNARVNLRIVEPEGSTRPQRSEGPSRNVEDVVNDLGM